MASLAKPRFMPEEYLAMERQADRKSEYYSSEIFAMAGASYAHNVLVANVARKLGNHLEGGPCRAVTSDQRVLVMPTGLYTYPDVVIVCGQPQFLDNHLDTLTNPIVIIEVLSTSTELYDRGEKFAHYQRLESLRDYLLIAQDQCRVEHYSRRVAEEGQWLLTVYDDMNAMIRLTSIDAELALASTYEGVEFESGHETLSSDAGDGEPIVSDLS